MTTTTEPGSITMADGTKRPAYRTTYRDGAVFITFGTYGAPGRATRRKATVKQAATFVPYSENGKVS